MVLHLCWLVTYHASRELQAIPVFIPGQHEHIIRVGVYIIGHMAHRPQGHMHTPVYKIAVSYYAHHAPSFSSFHLRHQLSSDSSAPAADDLYLSVLVIPLHVFMPALETAVYNGCVFVLRLSLPPSSTLMKTISRVRPGFKRATESQGSAGHGLCMVLVHACLGLPLKMLVSGAPSHPAGAQQYGDHTGYDTLDTWVETVRVQGGGVHTGNGVQFRFCLRLACAGAPPILSNDTDAHWVHNDAIKPPNSLMTGCQQNLARMSSQGCTAAIK